MVTTLAELSNAVNLSQQGDSRQLIYKGGAMPVGRQQRLFDDEQNNSGTDATTVAC